MSVWLLVACETTAIFLLFYLYAGWPPPSVNEAHYLTKAKHYWNPAWCANDQFLSSADAHQVFYWTFGWITQYVSLPVAAWIGRCAGWFMLAVGWQRLCMALRLRPGFSLLSAAIYVSLLHNCHMAGEWVIGGVEAKVFAYAFVFAGLAALGEAKWSAVWILLGIASMFHPLVGGWSILAAAASWLLEPRDDRPQLTMMLVPLAIGGGISLLGLLPAISLSQSADPTIVNEANYIYVFHRLPHHLVFQEFPLAMVARFGTLFVFWIILLGKLSSRFDYARLRNFVVGALFFCAIGILVSLTIADWRVASGVLRYYWFRLADASLPLAVACGVACHLQAMLSKGHRVAVICMAVAVLLTAWMAAFVQTRGSLPSADIQGTTAASDVASGNDWQSEYSAWRDVCRWIERATPQDAIFLAPPERQTFKWYAQRAQFVTWKDVPQDALSVREWWRRRQQFRTMPHDAALRREAVLELSREYGLDYVVARRDSPSGAAGFSAVYQSGELAVYEIPNGLTSAELRTSKSRAKSLENE